MDQIWKPRKRLVIGDIHGHYGELMALINQAKQFDFDLTKDQLITLGDQVDVGPDAKLVVQQLMDWQKEFNKPNELHVVSLYGNHEDLMLDALNPTHPIYGDYYIWWNQGGKETLKSYQPEGFSDFEKAIMQPKDYLTKEHLDWIAKLPYYYETADFVFVHAGLPDKPLFEIRNAVINQEPEMLKDLIWIRDAFINSSFVWGKKIIYAHTPTPTGEPYVSNNRTKINLNTMPRNTGKLTALEIPSMKFYFQPKL